MSVPAGDRPGDGPIPSRSVRDDPRRGCGEGDAAPVRPRAPPSPLGRPQQHIHQHRQHRVPPSGGIQGKGLLIDTAPLILVCPVLKRALCSQKKAPHARGGGVEGCVLAPGGGGSCIAPPPPPPPAPTKKKLLLPRNATALAMTFLSGLFNKTGISGKRLLLLPHLNATTFGSMLGSLLPRRIGTGAGTGTGTAKAPSLRGHGNMTSLQRQHRKNITPMSNEKRMQGGGVLFARV